MKNILRITRTALILILFVFWVPLSNAQGPPPPPGDHGQNTNQPAGPGGSAPIGSAVALMIGLFGAYGAKKAWDSRKKLDE